MMLLSCASRAATAAFALSEVLYLLFASPSYRHGRRRCTLSASGRAVPAQTWAGVSPVPALMWEGRAQSRCRADVGGASPVPAQTWPVGCGPVGCYA